MFLPIDVPSDRCNELVLTKPMKLLLLAVSLLFVTVYGPCSTEAIDQQPASQSATPSLESSAFDGFPTPPYEEMLGEVARLSKEVGIVNRDRTRT